MFFRMVAWWWMTVDLRLIFLKSRLWDDLKIIKISRVCLGWACGKRLFSVAGLSGALGFSKGGWFDFRCGYFDECGGFSGVQSSKKQQRRFWINYGLSQSYGLVELWPVGRGALAFCIVR